tara:strand:- start:543 stop:1406 length:864 start_codon:yes stop_codon:yes gene_type:complete
MEKIEFIECPRDAMQGHSRIFSIDEKVSYLKTLMPVGFSAIDIGSFVSSKAVPQMKDTSNVLDALIDLKGNNKFLTIAANNKGVHSAIGHKAVDIIGYPFSASETFQKRNTNRSRKQALEELKIHAELIDSENKKLVVYISMAFGNPYLETVSNQEILDFIGEINNISNFEAISLSDTVAKSSPASIKSLVSLIKNNFTDLNLGLHLHVPERTALGNGLLQEAWDCGIKRFDSALLGYGGCPFAEDSLSGNLPTESLLSFANSVNANNDINTIALEVAHNAARDLFL